ncbi:helix-turn-helix domain-containing protein [Aquimarina amphilecti]|nr:helix-turn-helix domain-containing protein [Aquimarina amphilecti]
MNRIAVFIVFFLFQQLYSQGDKAIDSLDQKSYDELSLGFDKNIGKIVVSKLYATTFLKKAKSEKNISKQADGYYMFTKILDKSLALKYTDSIINLTKNQDNFIYPAEAHLLKANILGGTGKYKEAMEELVEANNFAKKNKNIDQQYRTKYFIALLQDNLGEYEETLKTFRSLKQYYENKFQNNNSKYRYDYLKSMYALGNAYNNLELYDSAYYENRKAIELSLNYKDSILYSNLLLSSGVTDYFKKDYKSSIDSIEKFNKIYDSRSKINKIYFTTADLYLGKVYYELNDLDKSMYYLEKVDSATFSNRNFFPSLRSAYEVLIEIQKEKENTNKQLFYIERLLEFDSISNNDSKNLYKKINEEYSTPNLLSEKQSIIDSLEQKSENRTILIVILILLSFALLLFLYINNRKKKIYQSRFKEMFEQKEKISEVVRDSEPKKENKDIGISEDIVEDILRKLKIFEEKQEFIKSNITVSSLSKDLKTNSKYLSKTINFYKEKSFSNYINDLRIQFVVDRLKSDSKFRKYTIKAIANEIGFNTTEAFSKSFYKTTGIYPSFFLKQLEKKEFPEG